MHEIRLETGLTIAEHTYTRLSMQPLTAGEAIDAAAAGETVRFAPDGAPVIVTSPATVNVERLRRQIKQLQTETGETLLGPVQIRDLRAMTEKDYRALTARADMIDDLYLQRESGGAGRGRDQTNAATDGDGVGA